VIYAGPKDHDLLTAASKDIGGLVQRQQAIDLEGMIDYGFLGWLSRPLAVPILRAITYLNKYPAVMVSRLSSSRSSSTRFSFR
jgi:hypothetical protein